MLSGAEPDQPVLSDCKSSFAAVADVRTRVLILGSLPGEISLSRSQYYANRRNQFWRLIGHVTGRELGGLPYPERLATLLSAGVGLWDVVRTAKRMGSLDANIRSHEPNPLETFAATLPALHAVGFNGAKASEIGRKQLSVDSGLALFTLPSSSPAYTIPFERKLEEWLQLKPFVTAHSA